MQVKSLGPGRSGVATKWLQEGRREEQIPQLLGRQEKVVLTPLGTGRPIKSL